ncbi:shikimate dehydrogenase [Corynebacterium bovis]|uniref:shikimate dehydrogenase n=1 Tax=Corynebacterium bovis TaxID=36808 RepID=UPI001639C562|nr:shikimate dehydrogenase [Corynebacterium bovis]
MTDVTDGDAHGGPATPGVLDVDGFLTLAAHRTQVCAVLGRPVDHSRSPELHQAGYRALGLVDATYERVEAGEAQEIRRLLTDAPASVRGFSVTMPGKAAAHDLADEITDRAALIGSANALVPLDGPDGRRWLADNTDVDGLVACLDHVAPGEALRGRTAVIVGNGGTARPAVAAVAAAGARAVTVAARSERALNLQTLVESYGMDFDWVRLDDPAVDAHCAGAAVVVSTVPEAGAAPHADAFVRAGAVVDVIYDPYPTTLQATALRRGVPVADGLRMLAGQAEEQFRLFTGHRAPEGEMLRAVLAGR